jgi:putative ABC transport system permease protein
MLSIAWKNLWAEKARFGFSVAGVAVAALLLAFMLALYSGWKQKIASYVQDVPADVWVVQKGNESFFSASFVPEARVADVRGVPGVTNVGSMLGRSMKISSGGSSYDSYVIGFDAGGIGGPIRIDEGSGTPGAGEIVIDDVLARTAGFGVGEAVTVGDRPFKVVGISSGGNNVIYQLSFVSKDEARKFVGLDGVEGFILAKTEPGRDVEVAAAINDHVDGVTAFRSKNYASMSRKVLQKSMLPILSVVLVLVFAVGAVVVGLTIYTATLEKEREFGVMKALGTPNKFLAIAVVEQSMLCGLIGFAIGQAGVLIASRFAERMVPQFVTLIRWQDALLVFGAVALMSLLAAYLPVQKVMRVDPLVVFKA